MAKSRRRASRGQGALGSVEIDWISGEPAVSLPDSHPFACLRADGPPMTDNGSASSLFWIPVPAYPWVTQRGPSVLGNAVLDGVRGCPLAPVAGRVREGERSLSPLGRRVRRGVWPRRMASRSLQICPPCGWTAPSCAHARAAGAPRKKSQLPPSATAGATSAPRSIAWRIDRVVPSLCLRVADAPTTQAWARVATWDRRAAVRPARGPGL